MHLLVGAIVFVIGVFILNLGVTANITEEYAILYLASVIAICTSFLTRTIKETKQSQHKSTIKGSSSYLNDFLEEFNKSKKDTKKAPKDTS